MHVSVIKEIRTSRSGRLGLGILIGFLLLSFLAPFLKDSAVTQTEAILEKPSIQHFSGTNDVGQDVFSRLVLGTRTSVIITLGVAGLALFITLLIGVSAGYIGGWYERTMMRVVDAFLVIPVFIVLLLVSAFVRPGPAVLILFIALLKWPTGARIIRAQTKSLKEKKHIHAAESFGAGKMHIFFRHILPDLGPLLVFFTVQYARAAVFMEAGLAFIGIADPLMISWGTIFHHAFKFHHLDVWWWLFPPGILLSIFILALTVLGYSMEKVIEPRFKNA